jgi:CheY-like chemotaxis protein
MSQRILIVDDERGAAFLLARILELHGYAADTAADGAEAQRLFAQSEYRLVLLDYNLPGMKGIELFTRLRQLRADVVGVLLTGYGEPQIERQAVASGMRQVLIKPAGAETIVALAKAVIGAGDTRE